MARNETAASVRVQKAFDEAFVALREETERVASALGFIRPVTSLSEVLDVELRRSSGGWKQKKFLKLPAPMRARIRCAEIIEYQLYVIERPGTRRLRAGFLLEIAIACSQFNQLQEQLAIALGREVAEDAGDKHEERPVTVERKRAREKAAA